MANHEKNTTLLVILFGIVGGLVSMQNAYSSPEVLYRSADGRFEATNEPLESKLVIRGFDLKDAPVSSEKPEFNLDMISPTLIVSIGKLVWPIIEGGRPVANIQADWAGALPEGVKSWEDLSNWKQPISKSYSFSWKNMGVRVIQFDYTVTYTPGGSLNGKGRYLTDVTVIPSNVSIFWGYKFASHVQVTKVANAGSSTDPVAAMQLVLTWTIDTPLTHHELSSDFYMTGAGEFKEVVCPLTQTGVPVGDNFKDPGIDD